MVEEGLLSVSAAERHPYKNRLRHVIDTSEQLERVDINTITLHAGDRYLLSTDGLHGEVGDEEIKKVLATTATPQQATEQLLAKRITGIAVFSEISRASSEI